ncbi:cyanophycinase [Pseudoduganella flava]|uniref:Cyanophycinase n=1 Tax=Pseudoduganella flava TaxID=871742 RepID=A0A562PWU4_9BURK|nr:cyanophycinase [Pseudoduganella flava]QGZ39730.1 cyanophycinase [Pseudoduganella flava]TWI48640.1 cyanophycinase [Pseudoduganella flava]
MLKLAPSLALSLALAVLTGAVQAQTPDPVRSEQVKPPASAPKGSLVIIGGGLRGDNADVWGKIVNLAGGKGARIAVFPSASGSPERAAQSIIGYLKKYGADAFAVPVAIRLADSDYRKAADDVALAKKIRDSDGVYFAGGDQSRITQALVREDGTRTAVLEAVWDVYRRGGVVAGSSAGAAIMSSTMFYNPKAILAMLRTGVTDGQEIAPGLGFVGDDVFIDQHLLVRGRFARMIPAMLAKNYKLGLGVDEDSAMVINGKREVEVIGYTGALLIDLSHVVVDKTKPDFNVSNVRLSYLDRGDKFNIITQSFTPSPDKAGGRLDPQRPALRGPVYTNDILGNSAVVNIMERLIDSDQEEAIGIAAGNPRSTAPEVGFEFRFTKTPESVGYISSVAEAYSVLNIRLDVRPIDIPRPLYKYR